MKPPKIERRARRTDSGLSLTPRWSPMAYHAAQSRLWRSEARCDVAACGRRSGKTEIAKRKIVRRAISETRWSDARFVAGAPTHGQAKRIFWQDLKALSPQDLVEGVSESELSITYWNGAVVTVTGLDVPARIEGPPLNGIILDEYANMRAEVWTEHVRPMLAERRGWALFSGVPEGRNHFYELWTEARADQTGDWAVHHWTMEEVLPLYLGEEQAASELAALARDLDELSYDQEVRGSFVSFTGRAYYNFDAVHNSVHGLRSAKYDPRGEIAMCFDFNVSPGVAAILQENDGVTNVIGEVYVPRNSNTPLVCRKLIADWGEHEGVVACYGDATGGARGTAKVSGSDWDLIRDALRPTFGERLRFRVPTHNPPERVRVNAVNSRVLSKDGTRRLFVDAGCAAHVVNDFEGVRVVEGGAGEIDKDRDPKLTHLTDAVGYYVHRKHPSLSGTAVSSTQV